jgi:hypothetical protein
VIRKSTVSKASRMATVTAHNSGDAIDTTGADMSMPSYTEPPSNAAPSEVSLTHHDGRAPVRGRSMQARADRNDP